MSKVRYYYDCPIKSAYMAKYFGMKFMGEAGEPVYLELSDQGAYYMAYQSSATNRSVPYIGKFYIHPDSQSFLAPKADDLMRSGECLFVFGSGLEIYDGFHSNDVEIIQRNGLPFIWPQKEEE